MNDFIMHYGVSGQKWGIRRYQNADGTLTPEGMARYGISDGKNKTERQNKMSAEERRSKTNKVLAAVGGLTLASLAAFGIWKATGNMKKEFIRQAGRETKKAISDSLGREYSRFGLKPTRDYQIRSALAAKKWNSTQINATRMDAVRNWVRNKGKITTFNS